MQATTRGTRKQISNLSSLWQGGTTSPQSGVFGPRVPVLAATPSLSAAASTNTRLKFHPSTTPFLHICLPFCSLLVFHLSLTLYYLHSLKAQIHNCSNIQLLANPVHCPLSLWLSSLLQPSLTPCIISISLISCILPKGEATLLVALLGSPNRCHDENMVR
jgi:hypothetical protein